MNIALVGGGKAAATILNHFRVFREHRIVGIADLKTDAPGILRALELGIDTTTDMKSLVTRKDVELVIEITGSRKVQEMISNMLRPDQQMVTAEGAKLMTDLIDAQADQNSRAAENISANFNEITMGLEKTLEKIDISFKTIERLLKEGNIISVNAGIEAARAGTAGKPFEIVVKRIADMVKNIKEASDNIGLASQETRGTLKDLHTVEKNLQKSFSTRNGDTENI